jgi:hypothetical protein
MPFPAVCTYAIPSTDTDPPGVPDLQSDVCPIFADGFESGDVSRWSDSLP